MYSLNKIKNEITKYQINQIINSGENDMFDNKIDIEKVKDYLQEEVKDIKQNLKQNTPKIDLTKSLNDIEKDKLFESIINLKNSHVG